MWQFCSCVRTWETIILHKPSVHVSEPLMKVQKSSTTHQNSVSLKTLFELRAGLPSLSKYRVFQKYLTHFFHVIKISWWSKNPFIKNNLLHFSENFFLCNFFVQTKQSSLETRETKCTVFLELSSQQKSQFLVL